jgi:leucyl aminopeptidase (aminopeptidase T)
MADSTPSEPIRRKVARSIWTRNLRLRPGEHVTIEAWNHTLPWSVSLAREARRIGANPLILYEDESAYWDAVDDGGAKLIGAPIAHEFAALAKTDVYVHLWGPGDRVRLAGLPEKQLGNLFAFNEKWYAAAQKAGVRGARLELGRPYPTLAKAYGVDESTWVNQLVQGTLVDPVKLTKAVQRVAKAVGRKGELRLRHSNGTDLKLRLTGKPARAFSGVPRAGGSPIDILATIPSGSIRVPLDMDVADGTFVGNRTNYTEGAASRGVTLHFAGGKLTEHSFETGGDEFDAGFAKGGKGRDQPGMLGIGLNPALKDTPQLEDVERGAIMVSVGGNRFIGGRNPSPFFGWGIVAGATLELDGKRIAI